MSPRAVARPSCLPRRSRAPRATPRAHAVPARSTRCATGLPADAGCDGMPDRNVLGGPLEECGTDPVTGFYRDGCCTSGPEDLGSHTVCAVVTEEFLAHQLSVGNDLVT